MKHVCVCQLSEQICLPESERVSEGKKDGNRENDEQENCSLNPPANPPAKQVKSVKPAEQTKRHSRPFNYFLLSFFPCPSLISLVMTPSLTHPPIHQAPFHTCSPCPLFHPHPCYSILLPPSLGCYISLPVTMTDLIMVVVGLHM